MSVKGDIALKIKMGSCDLRDLETLLTQDNVEVLHFDNETHHPDEDTTEDLTKEQIEAIDRIIAGSHVKRYADRATNSAVKELIPIAENVDFIQRGRIIIRVMDNHNFYEAEQMTEEYLRDAPIGLLTKLWISISKSLKE